MTRRKGWCATLFFYPILNNDMPFRWSFLRDASDRTTSFPPHLLEVSEEGCNFVGERK